MNQIAFLRQIGRGIHAANTTMRSGILNDIDFLTADSILDLLFNAPFRLYFDCTFDFNFLDPFQPWVLVS